MRIWCGDLGENHQDCDENKNEEEYADEEDDDEEEEARPAEEKCRNDNDDQFHHFPLCTGLKIKEKN